jgi:hypothetical protein
MCDYSLHAVPNRLAVEGEELVTHRLPTSSIGLASPLDLMKARREGAGSGQGASRWRRIRNWLNPPPIRDERVPAVCIPPGARLAMHGIRQEMQTELCVGPNEDVTFVELSASAYRYRDGVRFRNGRELLLQYLDEGLRFDVLSLSSAEARHEDVRLEETEAARIRR